MDVPSQPQILDDLQLLDSFADSSAVARGSLRYFELREDLKRRMDRHQQYARTHAMLSAVALCDRDLLSEFNRRWEMRPLTDGTVGVVRRPGVEQMGGPEIFTPGAFKEVEPAPLPAVQALSNSDLMKELVGTEPRKMPGRWWDAHDQILWRMARLELPESKFRVGDRVNHVTADGKCNPEDVETVLEVLWSHTKKVWNYLVTAYHGSSHYREEPQLLKAQPAPTAPKFQVGDVVTTASGIRFVTTAENRGPDRREYTLSDAPGGKTMEIGINGAGMILYARPTPAPAESPPPKAQ